MLHTDKENRIFLKEASLHATRTPRDRNDAVGQMNICPTTFENSVVWGQLFTEKIIPVTYGKNIAQPERIETSDLLRVMNLIKSDKLLAKISKIRGTYYEYGNALRPGAKLFVEGMAEVLRDKYQALKRTLPWFCMAVFEANASGPARRRLENLSAVTGLIIDIDHVIQAHCQEATLHLIRDKVLDAHFIFCSPTDGVKIVFVFKEPMLLNEENRAQVLKDFRAIYDFKAEEVSRLTGLAVDRACSDPTRACFMSWDRGAVKRNSYVDIDKWKRDHETHEKDERHENHNERLPGGGRDPGSATVSAALKEKNSMDPCLRRGDRQAGTLVSTDTKYVLTEDDFAKARQIVTGLAQIKFDYQDFIKVGLALYAGFGEAGKELWDLLTDNPNYHDTQRQMDTRWRSFHSVRSTTLASLFYVGEKYGIRIN